MDRLTSMAVFAKVASAGSFTQAAKEMRLSPAAVSKHVQLLEEWLGARLLNRTTRRVSLTETGASFYERSLRVIEDVEEARTSVADTQARPRGLLRVTAPISFGTRHLAPVFADYLSTYPEISLDVVLDDRMVDIVDEGFDVAVRIGQLKDSSLIARRLGPSREVVCAAPSYLARRGTPKHPADLARHDCIDYALRMTRGSWQLVGPKGEITVKIASARMTASNGGLLRHAALAGAGIIMCPTFLVGEDLSAGRLRLIMPQYQPVDRTMYAVYPSRHYLSAKVRSFVDFLAARFGEDPPWDAWRKNKRARPKQPRSRTRRG